MIEINNCVLILITMILESYGREDTYSSGSHISSLYVVDPLKEIQASIAVYRYKLYVLIAAMLCLISFTLYKLQLMRTDEVGIKFSLVMPNGAQSISIRL